MTAILIFKCTEGADSHARCSPKRKALDLDYLTKKKRTVNSLRNTVNNLISPNKISQNDEKPHTAELDDTAIPHVKIKITEIPHEKKPNTVNPHVPLHIA